MKITKKIAALALVLILAGAMFTSCRRNQGCPTFSIEISQ